MRITSSSLLCLALALTAPVAHATETCTTQSQMQPADRDALAAAALALAAKVQANDQAGVKSVTISEYQSDFAGIGGLVAGTAQHLAGAHPQVEQVYVLDASTDKPTTAGANPDAQFFCTLNKSAAEADFSIPQLPPGRYAFAMVRMDSTRPLRLSFLLRSGAGGWQLAGFYPKPLTAGSHDGLWYWQQARTLAALKQPWNAWLYLEQAQSLLQPAAFVSSTHLEKLGTELTQATPPPLASIGDEAPFVLKAADGAEFRFTSIATDDSLGKEKVDVAAHLKVDQAGDPAEQRKRNLDAMHALVAAHPELRTAFHGVWIFADTPNSTPYATEQAMAEIP